MSNATELQKAKYFVCFKKNLTPLSAQASHERITPGLNAKSLYSCYKPMVAKTGSVYDIPKTITEETNISSPVKNEQVGTGETPIIERKLEPLKSVEEILQLRQHPSYRITSTSTVVKNEPSLPQVKSENIANDNDTVAERAAQDNLQSSSPVQVSQVARKKTKKKCINWDEVKDNENFYFPKKWKK
jgi:hypothetical protein